MTTLFDDPLLYEFDGASPGMLILPTGRRVYWTGRVAIGSRVEPQRPVIPGEGMARLQRALIDKPTGFRAAMQAKRATMTRDDWIDVGHFMVGIVAAGILIGITAVMLIERIMK